MGKAGEYDRNIHRNMNTELFGKVSSLMRAYRASSHAAVRLKVFISTASDGWRSDWPL